MKTKKLFQTVFGDFTVSPRSEELQEKYPLLYWQQHEGKNSRGEEITSTYTIGYREGLEYKMVGHNEYVDLQLSIISPSLGHVVIDRGVTGWYREAFVVLKNGEFPKCAEFKPFPSLWVR